MIRPLIMGIFWGTVLPALICCEFAIGQVTDRRWEFEVASVKPAAPDGTGDPTARGGPGTSDPGQVTYERTWLQRLVADAYGVRVDQVSGPDWMKSEGYSVVAKIPPDTTEDQFHAMLQNLLADRFHLTFHHQTKTPPVYILSVASGGPKLTPASADPNAATAPPAPLTCQASDKNRFPALAPGRTKAPRWCPSMAYYTYRQTMGEFALGLGNLLSMSNGDGVIRGGPPAPFVVDETGLAGRFEFKLEFAGTVFPSSPALI
ncbi:MAG TPA: TIGR03435 family protein [Bryobacteraceae bacterium]